MEEQSIRRVLNTEYTKTASGTLRRRINKDGTRTPWEPVTPLPESDTNKSPLTVMLVLENQAPGEPKHWSLFVARKGEKGTSYQVTGDATFMTYNHLHNVDILSSDSYHTSYIIATLNQSGDEESVKRCVDSQLPPRAATRKLVTENCQGWTVRVMERLCSEGLLEGEWIEFAKTLQESV